MPQWLAMTPPRADPITIPPVTPIRLTLVTRPCISVGTARWRTVVEIVPQTKACAPNTKNTTRATAGSVFTARTRWVRVSMTRPPRMMLPRLTCRSSQPKDSVPTRPPQAAAEVSSPKPTSPIPSRSSE